MTQTLPEEIWLKIFTHLNPVDLSRAALACQQWSQLISQSESLWKSKCLSVTDTQIKQQILSDKKAQKCWKEAYQDNYGHRFTKRQWLEGKISNIISLDELPAKAFCPMDAHTWGEIFERELKR
ncbi:F-box only protein 48-like [Babylonia areolata]|uniref:F-box only protein 48-like n=1 Tax=Babylonia areolata TaxID=304850 RepID=UPI003FD3ACE4